MTDDHMAQIARSLADALRDYARERSPEIQERIAALNTELCAARRAELIQANPEDDQ